MALIVGYPERTVTAFIEDLTFLNDGPVFQVRQKYGKSSIPLADIIFITLLDTDKQSRLGFLNRSIALLENDYSRLDLQNIEVYDLYCKERDILLAAGIHEYMEEWA